MSSILRRTVLLESEIFEISHLALSPRTLRTMISRTWLDELFADRIRLLPLRDLQGNFEAGLNHRLGFGLESISRQSTLLIKAFPLGFKVFLGQLDIRVEIALVVRQLRRF